MPPLLQLLGVVVDSNKYDLPASCQAIVPYQACTVLALQTEAAGRNCCVLEVYFLAI